MDKDKERQFFQQMTFGYWFDTRYQLNLNYASPIMVSQNRTQLAKFQRIKLIAQDLLDNPDKPIEQLRKEIALKFFVTMRTALDYINYAKLILEFFHNWKAAYT